MKRIIFTILGIIMMFMLGTSHSVLASDYETYTVKSGDSLWKISKQYKIDINDIIELNNIKNNVLQIGQTLKIPTPDGQQLNRHVVKKGDNLWSLAHTYNTTVSEIKRQNGLTKDVLQIGQIITIRSSQQEVATSSNQTTANSMNQVGSQSNGKQSVDEVHGYPFYYTINSSNDNSYFLSTDLPINDQLTLLRKENLESANDSKKQTVKVASTEGSRKKPSIGAYTKEDYKWLATIIEAEAEDQPYLGKLAVGSVVVNRVNNKGFPNSIKEVIFQRTKRVYQFSPVGDGRINRVTPSEDSYKAAEAAIEGEDPTNGALFFYNPKIATSRWIETREVAVVISDHTFAY